MLPGPMSFIFQQTFDIYWIDMNQTYWSFVMNNINLFLLRKVSNF